MNANSLPCRNGQSLQWISGSCAAEIFANDLQLVRDPPKYRSRCIAAALVDLDKGGVEK